MNGNPYKDEELQYMLNNFHRFTISELRLKMAERFGILRSTAGLYGKWKSMMFDLKDRYKPRPLHDNNNEEIKFGLTPYQKQKIKRTKPPAAISTLELIKAMGISHSIQSLSQDLLLPKSVIRNMVTSTGVPKKYADDIRSVLGIKA